MDKVLRPERFDADPNEASSRPTKRWQHWQTTFENFLETIEGDNLNKLNVQSTFYLPRFTNSLAKLRVMKMLEIH